MKLPVHITQTAEDDLKEALSYIDNVLQNPVASNNLLNEFSEKTSCLGEFPQQYPLATDPILRSWEIRFIPIRNYLAFYVVSANVVYVIRFLHGKQNWIPILRASVII